MTVCVVSGRPQSHHSAAHSSHRNRQPHHFPPIIAVNPANHARCHACANASRPFRRNPGNLLAQNGPFPAKNSPKPPSASHRHIAISSRQKNGGLSSPPVSPFRLTLYYRSMFFACGLNVVEASAPAPCLFVSSGAGAPYPRSSPRISCTRWLPRKCYISYRCRCAPACNFHSRHRLRPHSPASWP